jgi:hypothetical protein
MPEDAWNTVDAVIDDAENELERTVTKQQPLHILTYLHSLYIK